MEELTFAAYIERLLDVAEVELSLAIAMQWHEWMWGVPCGPTITMVRPKRWLGLSALLRT